ncbi:50S ribosomal protein L11 methyltransferase [Paenibacillus koleovorans]|uniref:50S ribosomal protein L11 methyltransferase n=1 Tax=Paenibacillus koleovorans TaxID=121608 RepID=UPI000FDB5B22|nr:50S ribosomal protein L11 methyltransferase [Paenibacillus koleovorans]
MRWHEITIHTTEEAVEMISNYFHELGAGGVSIEESGTLNKERDTSFGQWYEKPLNDIPEGEAEMKAYFAEPVDLESHVQGLREFCDMLRDEIGIDPGRATITVREVDEEDWANAWKQYYKPLRISDRLTIKPTWETYVPERSDELIIELDPGMAFGTGTHPTTSLCMQALEKTLKPGVNVIDVGTGSGVLAIAAVKLGANRVLALDLDPIAVTSALENVKLNDMESRVSVALSDLLGILRQGEGGDSDREPLAVKPPVELIVANILAEIILLFIDDVYEALVPGGLYIASGIYKNKEEAVEQGLLAAGFSIVEKHRDQDWIAFVAKKG